MYHTQNILRGSKSSRTATLSVEVALCLPILLMLLFGSYELARANMILHSTESAAYEGARNGIIPGATPEKFVNLQACYFMQSESIISRSISIHR